MRRDHGAEATEGKFVARPDPGRDYPDPVGDIRLNPTSPAGLKIMPGHPIDRGGPAVYAAEQ
jgi:hypothetical protein